MDDALTPSASRQWVSQFPDLVAEWDRDRNGALTPETVSAGSARMIWWRCAAGDDHVWRAKPNNRSRGARCPFCSNRRVSRTNSLAARFPLVAREWHPEKNGLTTPAQVVAASSRVVWWRCSAEPRHDWRASIRDRTRGQAACPYCTRRKPSAERSLADCHPALVAEWHPTLNKVTPWEIGPSSPRHVWWRCKENHAWNASVANRALRSLGCPECERQRQG